MANNGITEIEGLVTSLNVVDLGTGSSSNVTPSVVSPTARDARYYNMDHPKRGLAVIFNHEHFMAHLDKASRAGTNVDCRDLMVTFDKLHFEVRAYHNLTHRDLITKLDEIAETDHSQHDCLVIIVLSHGDPGVLYTFDAQYKAESIWMPFTADKCPTLAGKPKLFFIQACQGDRVDDGYTLSYRTETDGRCVSAPYSYRLPVQADFLIAYATVPGHYSWRDPEKGSWFIQALCAELNKNGFSDHLLNLLTIVTLRVAIDCESHWPEDDSMHKKKQTPCLTSMLTRLVHFTPKTT